MAYLALFVALGGTSYAAVRVGSSQIVNNSIRSKDIRNGHVTSRDIKNNDVRSHDVRNGTLRAIDFQPGQLPAGAAGRPGPPGGTGPAGERGEQGQQGERGPAGANGVSGYVDSSTSYTMLLNGGSGTIRTTTCPAGKRAVGGGFNLSGTDATVAKFFQVVISQRAPSDTAQWQVMVRNTDATARSLALVVTAVCVTAVT